MTFKRIALTLFILAVSHFTFAQGGKYPVNIKVDISEDIKAQVKDDGRLFLFLSKNLNAEPRTQTWPSPFAPTYIFAKNISDFKSQSITISDGGDWYATVDWDLNEVPYGNYNVQVLWDQDTDESRIDAPGNIYSEPQQVKIFSAQDLSMTLSKQIADRKLTTHELSKELSMKSELLSAFWNKPMYVKASILLPHGYDSSKAYPIRYNVAGYGGRYTRINRLLGSNNFMSWWDTEEAPDIITVFLDGEGPFGDSYQLDSDNSGPYGDALIKEFIPFIESQFRGTDTASTRFVDGCSTGGWVSLGLQLYYPDTFNGCYSYSPDAIEFENYQLINIYKDANAFENEFGYPRPVMRGTDGEPMLSMRDFIRYENVLGASDTYLNSGGQFSAHTALYSPKGDNGLPKPLWDPTTGAIDKSVAEQWKKYDFKLYAQKNWAELGPKLAGKIYIWMGDMDHFYLNGATRAFADFMKSTSNPKSDATIEFSAMEGHCSQYSHKEVLLMIQDRLDAMK